MVEYSGQFYVQHKSEIDAAWRIFIAHQKKHGGPFLQVHQRLDVYLSLRIESSASHLTALKNTLEIDWTQLPEVVFHA